MAIVDCGQAQMAEVFLPYALTSTGQTMFQRVMTDPGRMLSAGEPEIEDNVIDVENTANGVVPAEDSYIMTTAQAVNPQGYQDDEEDKAISMKIDDVYDKSIDAFEELTAYTQIIEPRYAARNAEVAAGYLKIALDAASVRAKVKGDKTKSAPFIPFSNQNSGTQNIVVADRNDLLKMMSGKGNNNE